MSPRAIAILNCRVPTPEGAFASGAILVTQGVIAAVGRDFLLAIPPDAILIDAKGGLVGVGEGDDGMLQPPVVGAPAHLVCHSLRGEVQWVMKRGETVFSPPGAATPMMDWSRRRENAIRQVMTLLARHEEHRAIERIEADGTGIDCIWRFRDDRGQEQEVTIRVVPALHPQPGHILILDRTASQQLPEAGLGTTRAHWWFYLHEAEGAIYCLPTQALKRWLLAHASTYPITLIQPPGAPQRLRARAIPIAHLQDAIPKLRVLPCPR